MPAQDVAPMLRRTATDPLAPALIPQTVQVGSSSGSGSTAVAPEPVVPPPPQPAVMRTLYCPVSGCPAADPALHMGWRSFPALRAHLDSHMLGTIPGRVPQAWLDQGGWTVCGPCGKLVARRAAHGLHRGCWAHRQKAAAPPSSHSGSPTVPCGVPDPCLADMLPGLMEIATAPITTVEHVDARALPLAEREYKRCLANVVIFNRKDG